MSTINNLQIYTENIAYALGVKVNIYDPVNLHHTTNISWNCSCNGKFMYKLGEVIVQGKWCKSCAPNGLGFIPTKLLYILSCYYLTGKLPTLMEVIHKSHFIVNGKNLIYKAPNNNTSNENNIYFSYKLFNKGLHLTKLNIKEILSNLNVKIYDNELLYDERSELSVNIYKLAWSKLPNSSYINRLPHELSIKLEKLTPDEIINTFKEELNKESDIKINLEEQNEINLLRKKIKQSLVNSNNNLSDINNNKFINDEDVFVKPSKKIIKSRKLNNTPVLESLKDQDNLLIQELNDEPELELNNLNNIKIEIVNINENNTEDHINDMIEKSINENVSESLTEIFNKHFINQINSRKIEDDDHFKSISLDKNNEPVLFTGMSFFISNDRQNSFNKTDDILKEDIETIKLSDLISNKQENKMINDINDLTDLEDDFNKEDENKGTGMFDSIINVLQEIGTDENIDDRYDKFEQCEYDIDNLDKCKDGETFNKINTSNMFESVLDMLKDMQNGNYNTDSDDTNSDEDEEENNEIVNDKNIVKILVEKHNSFDSNNSSNFCKFKNDCEEVNKIDEFANNFDENLINIELEQVRSKNDEKINETTIDDKREILNEEEIVNKDSNLYNLDSENVYNHDTVGSCDNINKDINQIDELEPQFSESETINNEIFLSQETKEDKSTPKLVKTKSIYKDENFDDIINTSNKLCVHGNHVQFKCSACDKTKQYKKKLINNCPYVEDYDLENIIYRSAKEKVTIKCKKHGDFSGNHKSIEEGKLRCPKCS